MYIITTLFIMTNGFIYYIHMKASLISNTEDLLEILASDIVSSMERSVDGEKFVEDLIGRNLRSAAIAIKKSLPDNMSQIKNQQLVHLRDELDLTDITLFQKVQDDIQGVRSSNLKEVNLSSKEWGYWYTALNQLFTQHQVTIPEGQRLINYWSGPYEVSTVENDDSVGKWGYYYDGTTDYIINPYVADFDLQVYQQRIGTNALIKDLIQKNPEFLKQITVINPVTFGSPPYASLNRSKKAALPSLQDRPIYYGSYQGQAPPRSQKDLESLSYNQKDILQVKKAISTKTTQNEIIEEKGKQLLRTYIPIYISGVPLVIYIVTDYQFLQGHMNTQLAYTMGLVITFSIVSLFIITLLTRWISQNQEDAVINTQRVYLDKVDRMFASIKTLNHDQKNHINTMHALAQLGHFHELRDYLEGVVGSVIQVNDILEIGNPVISAIIQSHMASAYQEKIKFFYEIDNLKVVSNLSGEKSVDIDKILSNLIKNAFEEVKKLPEQDRIVRIRGKLQGSHLTFSVFNTGPSIPNEVLQNIFSLGYTTKPDKNHSGYGIPIVMTYLKKHGGELLPIQSTEEGTTFTCRIPVTLNTDTF